MPHLISLRTRHPVCCILPPYILEHLERTGSQKQRDFARVTLDEDTVLRGVRRLTARRLKRLTTVLGLRAGIRAHGRRRLRAGGAAGHLERIIYTASNKGRLPGREVRAEGSPPSNDPAVDEAYDGLGKTYEFYHEVFERDSLDDAGMPLDASVHFQRGYANAMWNGLQMVFGDGDGDLFNRFTVAVDVIGHELTHGVIQNETDLVYRGQPGALNEHLADVFGSLVKQYPNQAASSADWLIGKGLFTKKVQGDAVRSLKAPGTAYDDPALGGKDPQPAHMRDYVRGPQDSFGVHINSGIPNHAFYLLATQLGGFAWEKAGLIWYEAMTSPNLRRRTNFRQFSRLTRQIAGDLFGVNSPEQNAVRSAWDGVGIVV